MFIGEKAALLNGMQITSGDKSNPSMLPALATSMTSESQLENDIALSSIT